MRFVSLQNNQLLPNKSKLHSFTLNSGVDIEDYDIIRTDRSRYEASNSIRKSYFYN